MRIGHASISENKNNGRDGKAKAGDQTGKEVCIREYYSKPWKTLLRAKDRAIAEKMAKACESMCKNDCIGYDQSQRLTLHNALEKIGYDYSRLTEPCECDCSSFMTVCAECAGVKINYPGGNAPVTANMVKWFEATGQFEVITDHINDTSTLLRGDILIGEPNTHTVMVLDSGTPLHIQKRRTLKKGMSGSDVVYMQTILKKMGYDVGKWGCDGKFGEATRKALVQMQREKGLEPDGICGPKSWCMLEQYN